MRTGFTGVKVVTAAAIFLSGCLLLYHMQDGTLGPSVPVPGPWLAAASLVFIAAVAAAWARSTGSQTALAAGLAMVGTQFVLLIATGIALETMQPKAPGEQLMAPLTTGATCLLAAMLAIATWMPLRSALGGHRSYRRARAMRARSATLTQRDAPTPSDSEQAERGFVVGVPGAESQAAAETSAGPGSQPQGAAGATSPLAGPPLAVECEVQIPLALVLSQLGQAGAVDESTLVEVRPDLNMSIPVSLVTPGLREGEVALPISALAPYLPNGIPYDAASEEMGEMTAQPMIVLPLEIIVPQIPVEAFALPERSSPDWMSAESTEADAAFVLSSLSGTQESNSDGVG